MNAGNDAACRAGRPGLHAASPAGIAVFSGEARRTMLFSALGMIAGSVRAGAPTGPIASSHPATVWQLIEALARQMPFSRSTVAAALGVPLIPADNASNEWFEFWTCPPVLLPDGVEVRVDLRLKRTGPHPGFMVLNLRGNCLSLADARARYPELVLWESPRGHSMNETTSYSAHMPWGRLSFGFAYPGPECLRSIAFAPTA